jgi:hypothetical protein
MSKNIIFVSDKKVNSQKDRISNGKMDGRGNNFTQEIFSIFSPLGRNEKFASSADVSYFYKEVPDWNLGRDKDYPERIFSSYSLVSKGESQGSTYKYSITFPPHISSSSYTLIHIVTSQRRDCSAS